MGKINALLMGICALSAVSLCAESSEEEFAFDTAVSADYLLTGEQEASSQTFASSSKVKNPDGSITTSVVGPNRTVTATTRATGGKVLSIVVTTPILSKGRIAGAKAVTKAPGGIKLGVTKTRSLRPVGNTATTGYAANGTPIYTATSTVARGTRITTIVTTYTTGTVITTALSPNGNFTQKGTDGLGTLYYTMNVTYSKGKASVSYNVPNLMDTGTGTVKLKNSGSNTFVINGVTGSSVLKRNGSYNGTVAPGINLFGPAGLVATFTFTPNANGTFAYVGFNANGQKTIEEMIQPDGSASGALFDPTTGAQTLTFTAMPGGFQVTDFFLKNSL